jgi:two-component system, NtrC family, sensor histidine kinase GlrK
MKKSLRPTSVQQLVLIALGLVGLPLVIALVAATVAVERFAARSQQAVIEAVQGIDAGRMLVEEITAMERHARQYQLLGDVEFLEAYLGRRERFQEAMLLLEHDEFTAHLQDALAGLHAAEEQAFAALSGLPRDSAEVDEAVASYPAMGRAARQLLTDTSAAIRREVEQMRREADRTQQRLLWQAMTAIPAALVLAIVGMLLIARPIRQVDQAIRRMGSGQFDAPVAVRGPRDLEELGERLDWLRLRLLSLDEQKIRFLRHISHELKTPLTAIREGAQLLADEVAGELTPAQAEILEILARSSIQLQRRIEDLLSFNTIVQGMGAPVAREPIDVGLLLERVLADHAVAIQARPVLVELDLAALQFTGDREQLRIIMDNLMSNAIKYSPPGGRIEVSTQRLAGELVIEVRDEGPGIAPDEQDAVFQPFFQGGAPYDGHVKGTGLGLAITREYVSNHGGSIEVVEVRRGACLRVRLPLTGDAGEEPGAA